MSFIVGQKIVLVDDRWQPWVPLIYKQLPIKDEIYTVRAVCSRREDPKDKGSESFTVAVLLQELRNPDDPTFKGKLELGFREERFRELEELSTEEILQAGQKDYAGQPLTPDLVPAGHELVPHG